MVYTSICFNISKSIRRKSMLLVTNILSILSVQCGSAAYDTKLEFDGDISELPIETLARVLLKGCRANL